MENNEVENTTNKTNQNSSVCQTSLDLLKVSIDEACKSLNFVALTDDDLEQLDEYIAEVNNTLCTINGYITACAIHQ